MAFPEPLPGLVIRYSYPLGQRVCSRPGRGRKGQTVRRRPRFRRCSWRQDCDGVPISHAPPSNPLLAVEIPAATKRRLGLDADRSWVVLTEANRFVWPGPDVRPLQPGDAASVAYGPLPYRLFEDIRLKFIAALKASAARTVPRTE